MHLMAVAVSAVLVASSIAGAEEAITADPPS